MKHECKQEGLIELLVSDIKEIKQDVKSLLQYKWQVMGGAAVAGAIISILLSYILK